MRARVEIPEGWVRLKRGVVVRTEDRFLNTDTWKWYPSKVVRHRVGHGPLEDMIYIRRTKEVVK